MKQHNKRKHDVYWKLRESFYRCRDFEINNLWQKSVLLTAFLVLSFTVYANLIPKLFFGSVSKNNIIIHEICCGLSLIGIVFAIVWIMMAKGSKAWYEIYESAICEIEKEKQIHIPQKYVMGNRGSEKPIDGNIFSNNAGNYSPSKLNIFIGRFFLIIWSVIFIIHFIFNISLAVHLCREFIYPCIHCIIITILFVLFIVIYITAICNTWARSSYLEKQ